MKTYLRRKKMWLKLQIQFFFERLWKAIRIYVIILLAMAIGSSWTIVYQEIESLQQDYQRSMVIINNHFDKKKEIEEEKQVDKKKEVSLFRKERKDLDYYLSKFFRGEETLAKAIFTAESGLSATAKNWNCHYIENGKKTSRSCLIEDREKAWSVDCGIAQINVLGTECPNNLMQIEKNLEVASAMYQRRGFTPWVAHNSGAYKKYL